MGCTSENPLMEIALAAEDTIDRSPFDMEALQSLSICSMVQQLVLRLTIEEMLLLCVLTRVDMLCRTVIDRADRWAALVSTSSGAISSQSPCLYDSFGLKNTRLLCSTILLSLLLLLVLLLLLLLSMVEVPSAAEDFAADS